MSRTVPASASAPVGTAHREVRLARRPAAGLALSELDLDVVEVPRPRPGPGQVLVRNRLMSVTAVMRSLMRPEDADGPGGGLPMPPYVLGEPLWGPAVGEVVEAPGPDGPQAGELVAHRLGWREYAVLDAGAAEPLPVEGPEALPDPAAHLSQGFTAWLGVVHGAQVRSGDTVFVSGAAGGVGSLTGQFARLRGAARVIGSTGSERKADILRTELGYDAVVLRGEGRPPVVEQLRAAAPEGLDAVVDNVGGEQLEAALALARQGARIGVIGSLAGQVSGGSAEPVALDSFALLARAVTLRGVRAYDHSAEKPRWRREFARGLREGTVTFPYARLGGIEAAPRALCELLAGRHLGAVLVEL